MEIYLWNLHGKYLKMCDLYLKVTTKTERAIQELFNTFTLNIIFSF